MMIKFTLCLLRMALAIQRVFRKIWRQNTDGYIEANLWRTLSELNILLTVELVLRVTCAIMFKLRCRLFVSLASGVLKKLRINFCAVFWEGIDLGTKTDLILDGL